LHITVDREELPMAKDTTDDLDHPAIREAFSDDVNLRPQDRRDQAQEEG
jgi:hypothetical protein